MTEWRWPSCCRRAATAISDVEGLIGAGRHERSADRLNYRNGYRDRNLDTPARPAQPTHPQVGSRFVFPPFLEPRKTVEKALVTVIQEAWIGRVSTRRVDELVQAMGLSGISKSQVSILCKDIDERVNAFLDRPMANGRICGSTRPISRSATVAASSRWPR